eukprot:gnl/Spiro4/15046_TR8110_c0_g1_i1.p1 gnl/Spiro4/15046_TR8110_c0_g1~~gnl/Spiro4/15046_TR8110_c0_g1_i1.p1  ORF type:complete len:275 (-),score=56.75 gnl/Spiro4/15046_TR8110_c0_g1_i1:126-950(-)
MLAWFAGVSFFAKAVGVTVAASAVLAPSCVHVVRGGSVAVKETFGVISPKILQPGLYFTHPFTRLREISLRSQKLDGKHNVPSKEGLMLAIEGSIIYHVDENHVLGLYQSVGPDYRNVLIEPHIRSSIRDMASKLETKDLYENKQLPLEQLLKTALQDLTTRGIIVESCHFHSISLPKGLSESIQEKLQMEQDSMRMSFVLEKEKQEAERKRIEARGIADFQQIVSQDISPNVLRWKGIEVTEALARSPNTKLVVIGNSTDGLPTVLSHWDGRS